MRSINSKQMLREIEREAAYTSSMTGRGAFSPAVMKAMETVPRERFVPEDARLQAFYNGPLPIGHGQTISQPYIVALMTDLLDLQPDDEILEVGTGSGYQAAILSRLVRQVNTMEIIEPLLTRAADTLRSLGYTNVVCRVGDGNHGWPEKAPFDGIIVTAAAPAIPPVLIDQLKPGARMVIPVGLPYHHQELMLLEKDEAGKVSTRDVLGVVFVPLTGNPARGGDLE